MLDSILWPRDLLCKSRGTAERREAEKQKLIMLKFIKLIIGT